MNVISFKMEVRFPTGIDHQIRRCRRCFYRHESLLDCFQFAIVFRCLLFSLSPIDHPAKDPGPLDKKLDDSILRNYTFDY